MTFEDEEEIRKELETATLKVFSVLKKTRNKTSTKKVVDIMGQMYAYGVLNGRKYEAKDLAELPWYKRLTYKPQLDAHPKMWV